MTDHFIPGVAYKAVPKNISSTMFSKDVKIELNLGENGIATSLGPLEGKVLLTSATPMSVRDISVRLLGRCRTCASVLDEGKTSEKIETETFLKVEKKIFPPKEWKQKELTLPAGDNRFSFALAIPEHATGGDSSRWLGRTLPPSVVFPYHRGRIEYDLEVKVHRPGFWGFTKKNGVIVPYRSTFIQYNPDSLVYAQRSFEVLIYDSKYGWAAMMWEALGYDQSSIRQAYRARMETPLEGIVLGVHKKLSDVIRRLKVEPIGDTDSANYPIIIDSVLVQINTMCRTTALNITEEKEGRTILLRAEKLNYRVPSDNDITALIAEAPIPPELPTSLCTPLAQISHELRVTLGVRPVKGSKRTCYVQLLNKLPAISGVIQSDEPPAYSAIVNEPSSISVGDSANDSANENQKSSGEQLKSKS